DENPVGRGVERGLEQGGRLLEADGPGRRAGKIVGRHDSSSPRVYARTSPARRGSKKTKGALAGALRRDSEAGISSPGEAAAEAPHRGAAWATSPEPGARPAPSEASRARSWRPPGAGWRARAPEREPP